EESDEGCGEDSDAVAEDFFQCDGEQDGAPGDEESGAGEVGHGWPSGNVDARGEAEGVDEEGEDEYAPGAAAEGDRPGEPGDREEDEGDDVEDEGVGEGVEAVEETLEGDRRHR